MEFPSVPRGTLSRLQVVLLLGVVLVPLLAVSFVPSADFPQHLAQVQLLEETLEKSPGPYRINWLAPNNLIYYVLALLDLVFDTLLAGRLFMVLLVCLWTYTVWRVSQRYQSSILPVIPAVILVFNHSFYWGFLNFLIGFPFFLLLVFFLGESRERYRWWVFALLFVLLYASHILWFGFGVLYYGVYHMIRYPGLRSFVTRISAFLPVAGVAAVWYPAMVSARQSAGFDLAAYWFVPPWERLVTPAYWVEAALGGLRGGVEPLVLGLVSLWVALCLITNRRFLRQRIRWPFFWGFALCAFFTLIGPEKYLNTIYFAQRWFPGGLVLLLLALPLPRLKKKIPAVLMAVLLLVFSAQTTLHWVYFNRVELSGLRSSLTLITPRNRVLGLDYIKESRFIRGRPFIQINGYAQALQGADISFSFAEHGSGIVSYRIPRMVWWTPGLEWEAEKVKLSDFSHFDRVLINALPSGHEAFDRLEVLDPITTTGRWRLYRVNGAGRE